MMIPRVGTLCTTADIQEERQTMAVSRGKKEIPKREGEYHEYQSSGSSLKAPTYTLSDGKGYSRLVSEAFHQGVRDRCDSGRTLLHSTRERLLQSVQGLWRLSVQPLIRWEGEFCAGLKGSNCEGTPRSRSRGVEDARSICGLVMQPRQVGPLVPTRERSKPSHPAGISPGSR